MATLVLVLLFWFVTPAWTRVTLQDGGYQEVALRIEDSTLPFMTHVLVPKLKELFTSASRFLHAATGQRVYFRDVVILVPSHWPGDYDTYVTSEEQYDVIVTKNLDWPQPRTIQSRGCEEPGDVIQLPQAFVQAMPANSGRLLVREWAKYRYGVFDEAGDVTYPATYWREEKLAPNLCTDVPLEAAFSWACNSDGPGISPECRFTLPPQSNRDVTSSIMADPLLPSVNSFCNSTTHQRHLANRQNVLCHYRSVWDVMSHHPDLQNCLPRPNLDTTPQFRLMKRAETAIVMVIDSSNKTAEVLHPLQQLSAEFFRDLVPRGSRVRVIEHGGGEVHDLRPWTSLVTSRQVEALLQDLPHVPEGNPALPLALEAAVEALSEATNRNAVLLVICGACQELEAFEPAITEQLAAWRTRLVVFCVADPLDARAPFLQRLQRGAAAHLYVAHPHGDVMSVLRGAFRRVTEQSYLGGVVANASVTLVDRHLSESQTQFVPMDPHLTANLTATFTYNVEHSIDDVMVVPPTGDVIILGRSPHCHHDIQRRMITCRVSEVEPGEWRIIVGVDRLAQDLRLHVTARCPSQCLTLTSWIADFDAQKNASTIPRVFGYVQRFGVPVQGAQLVAVVTSRYYPQHTARIQLRDDGLDPDVAAMDGVYTAYLAPLQEGGWHYVTVQTTNRRADSPLIPLPSYQRVSFAGSVWLSPDEGSGSLAPSRILDLSVQVKDVENLWVSLQWTAPGADLQNGTASAYDFRWSYSHATLREDFSTARSLVMSDVLVGSVYPQEAGSRQVVVVRLAQRRSVYFAVRAIDQHANTAPTSNIAALAGQQLKKKAKTKTSPAPPSLTTPSGLEGAPNPSPSPPRIEEDPKGDNMTSYLVVLVALGIGAVLLIVVSSCAIFHHLVKVDKHFRSGSYDFHAERGDFLMDTVHTNVNAVNGS